MHAGSPGSTTTNTTSSAKSRNEILWVLNQTPLWPLDLEVLSINTLNRPGDRGRSCSCSGPTGPVQLSARCLQPPRVSQVDWVGISGPEPKPLLRFNLKVLSRLEEGLGASPLVTRGTTIQVLAPMQGLGDQSGTGSWSLCIPLEAQLQPVPVVSSRVPPDPLSCLRVNLSPSPAASSPESSLSLRRRRRRVEPR